MVDLPTWLTPLRNLDQSFANSVTVADPNLFFGKSGRADILAKGTGFFQQRMCHVLRGEMGCPFGIMLCRIKVHCLVYAAMHRRIRHLVTLKAQFA